jgi:hypothetical protein
MSSNNSAKRKRRSSKFWTRYNKELALNAKCQLVSQELSRNSTQTESIIYENELSSDSDSSELSSNKLLYSPIRNQDSSESSSDFENYHLHLDSNEQVSCK